VISSLRGIACEYCGIGRWPVALSHNLELTADARHRQILRLPRAPAVRRLNGQFCPVEQVVPVNVTA
jgi:hypothetical protein